MINLDRFNRLIWLIRLFPRDDDVGNGAVVLVTERAKGIVGTAIRPDLREIVGAEGSAILLGIVGELQAAGPAALDRLPVLYDQWNNVMRFHQPIPTELVSSPARIADDFASALW